MGVNTMKFDIKKIGHTYYYKMGLIGDVSITYKVSHVLQDKDGTITSLVGSQVEDESGVIVDDAPQKINWVVAKNRETYSVRVYRKYGELLGLSQQEMEAMVQHLYAAIMAGLEGRDDGGYINLPDPSIPDQGAKYLVYPVLLDGCANLIFGDGGIGKSLVALFLGSLVQHGREYLGMQAEAGNVLYLDFEGQPLTSVNQRVKQINATIGINGAQQGICYRNITSPLENVVDGVAGLIYQRKITLLIIDSVGLAGRGALSDDMTARSFMEAINSLGVTTLLVHHIAKGSMEEEKRVTAYGSVYFTNLSRNAWEIRADRRDGRIGIGMFHTKHNYTKKHDDIVLDVEFGDAGLNITRGDIEKYDALAKRVSISERIVRLLSEYPMRPSDLAEQLGEDANKIRVYLDRLRKRGTIIHLPSQNMWALNE
jgi:hypothetical protein